MSDRLLLVSPSAVPGGAERVVMSRARQLPHFGYSPRVVLLQRGPLEDWLADEGCDVEVIDAGRTRQVARTASVVRALGDRAKDCVAVLSNQSKGHVYGGIAAARASVPALWWQQGTRKRSRIETAAALVPTSAIICSSRSSASAQRRLTPRRPIEVINLGIDVDAVTSRQGSGARVRENNGWEGTPLVGIVGRLQEWKGQEVFLRAAAQVARSNPDAVFVVVGGAVLGWEGDYPARLERLASELGIEGRVHFAGHQDDVYPWFDALDVVVHASYGEPFGLVLIEAMALGKPLVATAAGGPVEIVEAGSSGLLVPPGDDTAMAAAITKVLNDADLGRRLGEGARARALRFDENRMAERLVSLVHSVVEAGSARNGPEGRDLEEHAVPGLHNFVYRHLVDGMERGRALDLGAGSRAFAQRLARAGFEVTAVDRTAHSFRANVSFQLLDLDDADWASLLEEGPWSLVIAIEVIEHLEAPVAFLRNIARLLAPGGRAIVTTPNVDSLPARAKLLVRDRLRLLDEHGNPTHISPLFWNLLVRQYLPRANLRLVWAGTYPEDGFITGRPTYRRLLSLARPALRARPRLLGDNHVLLLGRADDPR